MSRRNEGGILIFWRWGFYFVLNCIRPQEERHPVVPLAIQVFCYLLLFSNEIKCERWVAEFRFGKRKWVAEFRFGKRKWVAEFRFGKCLKAYLFKGLRTFWQIGICQPIIGLRHYWQIGICQPIIGLRHFWQIGIYQTIIAIGAFAPW